MTRVGEPTALFLQIKEELPMYHPHPIQVEVRHCNPILREPQAMLIQCSPREYQQHIVLFRPGSRR